MSRKKEKLILKVAQATPGSFFIVKAVNTLEFGVPGDLLDRKAVDRILITNARNIREGSLTVEFV